jgi:hypothetical protein
LALSSWSGIPFLLKLEVGLCPRRTTFELCEVGITQPRKSHGVPVNEVSRCSECVKAVKTAADVKDTLFDQDVLRDVFEDLVTKNRLPGQTTSEIENSCGIIQPSVLNKVVTIIDRNLRDSLEAFGEGRVYASDAPQNADKCGGGNRFRNANAHGFTTAVWCGTQQCSSVLIGSSDKHRYSDVWNDDVETPVLTFLGDVDMRKHGRLAIWLISWPVTVHVHSYFWVAIDV